MKIPITLVPAGQIPRDPDLKIRLTQQTEPGKTETVTAGGVPTVAIGNGLLSEDLTEAVFTVELSAAWPFVVTVNWATQDDTALDGVDYTAASGTVTFAANETTQSISVALLGAGAVDDRRFNVNLSNPIGALITVEQGSAAIPGTPAVPSSSLLDHFDGTGTIQSHTADSGHSWTVLYGPTDWTLDGSGSLVGPGTDSGLEIQTNWLPPDLTAWWLEVDFKMTDLYASGIDLIVSAYAADPADFAFQVAVYGSQSSHTIYSQMSVSAAAGTPDNFGESGTNDVTFNVEHTLRMERSGDDFTMSIDGVQLHTTTMTGGGTIASIILDLGEGFGGSDLYVRDIRSNVSP